MNITENKDLATAFLRQVISGDVKGAYAKYVHSDFRHHNTYYPGDTASLMNGMEESERQFPHKIFEIKQVIAEGDRVVVHSHLRFKPEDVGMVVAHFFRFQDEKIIELWDIGQVIPENSPNQNGAF